MRNLEERLDVLERANRMQRRLLLSLGACVVALLSMGAGGGLQDVIQARRIELIDTGGKTLLSFEARDGRAVLELQSEEGQRAALLSNTAEGGALSLYDETGHAMVTIGADAQGGSLELSTGSGRTLLRLGPGAGEGGALATFAGSGQKLVELGATGDGDGTVVTYDAKGKELVGLMASGHGNGKVVAYEGGKERAWPES